MHRLICNKVSFLNSSAPNLKSLISFNKARFSNKVLEEGEYIEGDTILSDQIKRLENEKIHKYKSYVSLENLKNNLLESQSTQATKPDEAISNSLKNLQDKFKFQLAEGETLYTPPQEKK